MIHCVCVLHRCHDRHRHYTGEWLSQVSEDELIDASVGTAGSDLHAVFGSQPCLFYAREAATAGRTGAAAIELRADHWHNAAVRLYCGGRGRVHMTSHNVLEFFMQRTAGTRAHPVRSAAMLCMCGSGRVCELCAPSRGPPMPADAVRVHLEPCVQDGPYRGVHRRVTGGASGGHFVGLAARAYPAGRAHDAHVLAVGRGDHHLRQQLHRLWRRQRRVSVYARRLRHVLGGWPAPCGRRGTWWQHVGPDEQPHAHPRQREPDVRHTPVLAPIHVRKHRPVRLVQRR